VKVVGGLFGLVLALVLGVAVIAGGPDTGSAAPSKAATDEIPSDLLPVYIEAVSMCPGLPWPVLAAVGWTESRHAEGRADAATGDVRPPILGPALDGTNGTAQLADATEPDGWAHAHGPMQFLLPTWQAWGRLAPGRPLGATPSPDNAWDAIYAAAAYLCGGDGNVTDIEQALLSYNRSDEYVPAVITKAIEYGLGGGPGAAIPVEGMFCPVAGSVSFTDDWGDPRSGGRRHQGNDLFADYGSPLVAIEDGVIDGGTDTEVGLGGIALWLRGRSGTGYYYAHNARNAVALGDQVRAGQVIAYLGNTGNARTSPPHLHLQVHPDGGDPVDPYSTVAMICAR
jgi:hypothetical protein